MSATLPKPFRFFNFWTEHPAYLEVVRRGWNVDFIGSPFTILYKKLRAVKEGLIEFNHTEFAGISGRVKEAENRLLAAQSITRCDPSSVNVSLESALVVEWTNLRSAEESFFKQKARDLWVNCGDFYSSYFHRYVKICQMKNSITMLTSSQGVALSKLPDIVDEAVGFYKQLFGVRNSDLQLQQKDFFDSLLCNKLALSQVSALCTRFQKMKFGKWCFLWARTVLLVLMDSQLVFFRMLGRLLVQRSLQLFIIFLRRLKCPLRLTLHSLPLFLKR
ncbi:hypothetical protein LINPERHAP2_LOCUS14302 [Linum perenne]